MLWICLMLSRLEILSKDGKTRDDTDALSELPAYLNCTFTPQYIPACHTAILMNSPVSTGGLRLFRHEKS